MSEIIKEITEVVKHIKEDYARYEGYKITTNKQEVFILIESGHHCCEEWGYFISNDDEQEFIGATLESVELVDECYNPKELEDLSINKDFAVFVNINTSRGTLQFTVYNEHNGYYGHHIIVKSNQLQLDDTL